MHPHRKQGRVAAGSGRPVFYASLPAEGGSDTHAHAHISFFVGTFIDILDSPAAHTDPNQPKRSHFAKMAVFVLSM